MFDFLKSAYDNPFTRLFYDTNKIHREFEASTRSEFRPQLMAGQPRAPVKEEVPPPAAAPAPSPEAPKATTGPSPMKPSIPTPPVKLDRRPLPSPTAYLEQIYASGLLQGLEQGIGQEQSLASASGQAPKLEFATQHIYDPRITKAHLEREKRELAIAKKRASYVNKPSR
jgi:hypothetical protein